MVRCDPLYAKRAMSRIRLPEGILAGEGSLVGISALSILVLVGASGSGSSLPRALGEWADGDRRGKPIISPTEGMRVDSTESPS